MKVRVTESQYSKIRLLKEQEEYLNRFKRFCDEKAKEVDIIYGKIIHESIGGILSMSIDGEGLTSLVDKIETEVLNAGRNMTNLYDQGLIHGEDLDLVIERVMGFVTDKITSLSLLLVPIEKLQEYENERKLTKYFSNITPIEVGG